VIRAAALLFTALCLPAHAAPLGACTVARISDGDTLTVGCTGRKKLLPIRLQGIDTPEFAHFAWATQPWAAEATEALATLCPVASTVAITLVTYDPRTRRWIGRAKCGGTDASEHQARNGNAWAYLPPARSKVPALVSTARAARMGLWADPAAVEPKAWRRAK
jgi:micrococcal nuclease